MWDPATYLRFDAERARPFWELTARIGAERPRAVVDLGCGPGTLTRSLAQRWPRATVTGLDSSPEMIEDAVAGDAVAGDAVAGDAVSGDAVSGDAVVGDAVSGDAPSGGPAPRGPVRYAVGDVRDWRPGTEDDVVVCNAVLQWVPGHDELLTDWARALPAGAWLAVQVPGNFDAPSHRELRAVADGGPWRDRTAGLARPDPVRDASGYAELLTGAGCQVDAWETTYVHLLPAPSATDPGAHPVLRWMEGTALRPYRAALADDGTAWSRFRDALADRLATAYPIRHGVVQFPFRRIFFVARTGDHG